MSEIKVKPEVLREGSKEIKNYGEQLKATINRINQILNSIEVEWNGAAFLAFQMEFGPLNAKMNKLTHHVQGISKDLDMVANEIEMEDKGLASSIGSAFFLDCLARRTQSNENIVVSGNYYPDGHAARQFIEPAIKQIKDWQKEGKTDITWVLANSGYSKEQLKQIQETADGLGVSLMPITNKEDLIDYINAGENVNGVEITDRNYNKISDISVFSHGTVANGGTLALGFGQNQALDITTPQLQSTGINSNAFSSNFYTWFAACNIGTIRNNTSFAQEWVNKTGGTEEAVAGGRTDYEKIDKRTGISNKIWKSEDWIRRNLQHKDFDKDGCVNYPVESKDAFEDKDTHETTYPKWYEYEKDKIPEKIDSGSPR